MVRSLVLILLMNIGNSVVAQEPQRELSKRFAAAAPFIKAASGGIEVKTILSDTGEITVVAQLRDIKTRTSRLTSLPDKTEIGYWSVHFVLVPKLSKNEIDEIRGLVDDMPMDKAYLTTRRALTRNLPNVVSDTYAYRIVTSPMVPTERLDQELVKSFATRLSKALRDANGMNVEKKLQSLLLE